MIFKSDEANKMILGVFEEGDGYVINNYTREDIELIAEKEDDPENKTKILRIATYLEGAINFHKALWGTGFSEEEYWEKNDNDSQP